MYEYSFFSKTFTEGFSLRICKSRFCAVFSRSFFFQFQQKFFSPNFTPYLAEHLSFLAEVFSPNFMPYLAGFFLQFQQKFFLQNLHQYLAEGSSFFSRSFFLQILHHIQQVIFLQFQQKFVLQILCRRILCVNKLINFSRIFSEKAHSNKSAQ